MGRVDGKVALISGGARGMGASHARALVAEGARVFIGDVLDDDGKPLADDIGEAARYVHLDVTQPGLTKSAALELAPSKIRVNSIHPGFIKTPMTEHLPEDLVTIPLGRPGESAEVSSFVVFLASDESWYATGSEFVMDGGLVTDVPHKHL